MSNFKLSLAAGLIAGAIFFVSGADAQEEQLKAVSAAAEKQKERIGKLANRIQNFGFLDYARKLVDKLDKRERKIDPFGMAMDPKQEGGTELVMPADSLEDEGPKTSLQEAISKFRVTGVYPERKEVIVGAQSLRVGDQVVIKHGEVSFDLRIERVEADFVELVDVETGEKAGVSLGIVQVLPEGMTREEPVRPQISGPETNGTIVPMNRRFLTLD